MGKTDTIKVHIVDDSALLRQTLSDILNADPGIQVIGASANPVFAENHFNREWPDVIILDYEMPQKDGLTFLAEIMARRPTPVIMFTTHGKVAMQAFAAGAVEVLSKPGLELKKFLFDSETMLIDTVKSAAQADLKKVLSRSVQAVKVAPKLSADSVLRPWDGKQVDATADRVVVLGASTGGTQAIEEVLSAMPKDSPPFVIVQHMPEKFTTAFADRLNDVCSMEVKEASHGDKVHRGLALIAPGNLHMLLNRRGDEYFVGVNGGPLVSRHRPSVDVLFRSAAKSAGRNALGIILTGMGDDGAAGMLEMHGAGARTVAQDERSCVVFGMPKEAIRRGGVDEVLPLDQVAGMILKYMAR
ncbi:MAG: chemotaxis response regulator protein-glutamate methylesterase [Spirochaetes bacterium]|nr:MAG: chemotaxis response regulator protein-glutamate methylesterase [Spirochaetota bacterium]